VSTCFIGEEMNLNDLILVRVDDHLVEPATMFDEHVPPT
jgi:hypothetical protein